MDPKDLKTLQNEISWQDDDLTQFILDCVSKYNMSKDETDLIEPEDQFETYNEDYETLDKEY